MSVIKVKGKRLNLQIKIFLFFNFCFSDQKMFCIVSGCRLGYGTIGLFPSRIQNFEIPKDTVLRQKWLEAIPNPKNLEDQELRVCSLVIFKLSTLFRNT